MSADIQMEAPPPTHAPQSGIQDDNHTTGSNSQQSSYASGQEALSAADK
jgi:hypothetical protein